MYISTQRNPDKIEINNLFETTFQCLTELAHTQLSNELNQRLMEWFDIDQMISSLKDTGVLLEARDDENKLVGAVYLNKQNPILWPDGKKVEIYILATLPEMRRQGIGNKLLQEAEEVAINMGGKKILVSTHVLMVDVGSFYEKRGFQKMGVLKGYYDNGDAVFFSKEL